MGIELIFYAFSRSKVERGDFSHFLSLYALDKLPTGCPLRAMMNSMVFLIEDYDKDGREIHTIPAVRQFYSAFPAAWPYWLYFCNLDQEGLQMMTFCILKSITAIKVDGQPKCRVQCDPLELVRFIGQDFPSMNQMCERAAMSKREIYDRTRRVVEYFGFPFDAPPPA